MRRLVGLLALVVLIGGAWWLVQNGYDMSRITGTSVSEETAPAVESKQAAESPTESAGTATPEAGAPQAEPSTGAPTGEKPEASATASEAPSATKPPAAELTAEAPAGEAPAPEAAAQAAPAAGDVPTFDIVRVEPSGETVIAGQAAPNTTVELLDGPEAVATAEANERGEWALVLGKPLPPGTHDLAIRTTSKDKSTVTLSDQRVAVAVPADKNEEPLIVLSTPDAPSSVMQAPKELEIASVPPAETGAPTAPSVASAPEAKPAEPSSPSAAAPGKSETVTTQGEPAQPAGKAPAIATPEAEPPASSAKQPESDIATAEPPAASAPETAASPATGETPAAPSVAGAPAKPAPQLGVAAVEAGTDGSLYVAGTAQTKDPVRVYLDDKLIGEAKPTEGGTWLIETKREVAPGEYKVRADQVESGTGKVIVRAEVPFQREIDVAVLKPSSEAGEAGSAEMSGSIEGPMTVIIKRGDNLWRISRELYGRGVRFSTIYQANREQIRNPDMIYPGQVFVLPAGDTAWQN